MTRTVIIIQGRLLRYRVALFELLRERLRANHVTLRLIHGKASATERLRTDEGSLDWGEHVGDRRISVLGTELIWQHLPTDVRGADLVIVMQESRILSNYPLMARRRFGGPQIAYWGHGRNFQSKTPSGIKERWKTLLSTRVDWWFAYTAATAEIVTERGFPEHRVTILNNSIDVSGFKADLESVTTEELDALRGDLGIPVQARVGLYCGSIYPEKRIGLLIESAEEVRSGIPGFHLVVIGDGPGADEVRAAARRSPWIHHVGAAYGRQKAALYRLAEVQLNPGSVGLHVLDAFSGGLPLVTVEDSLHGPEIAYLESGLNGLVVTPGTPAAYAAAVIGLLEQDDLRLAMRRRCLVDSERYGVEAMADNFCAGILQCLART